MPISAVNFRGITIRGILVASRGEIHGRRRRRAVRRVSSNFLRDNVASRASRGGRKGRRMARGEPRAIVIKHRELAKLRCNLAGDVLPCGLVRRGPRAAPIHTHPSTYTRVTHVRARARKRECVCARPRGTVKS